MSKIIIKSDITRHPTYEKVRTFLPVVGRSDSVKASWGDCCALFDLLNAILPQLPSSLDEVKEVKEEPKRGRGRPRKHPVTTKKKKRGRPRKETKDESQTEHKSDGSEH